MQVSLF